MKRWLAALCMLGLFLGGCGWLEGSYVSVTPHEDQQKVSEQEIILVSDYEELQSALEKMVEKGVETGTISMAAFDERQIDYYMTKAVRHITNVDPLGAYAVDAVSYEQGVSGSVEAVAVIIRYNRNLSELQSIKRIGNINDAVAQMTIALDQVTSSVVMRVEGYIELDFTQLMQDYADKNPEKVMEMPQITVNTYPRNGRNRVMEVKFNYQSNRENLRNMQSHVRDVFASAKLYVSGSGEPAEKYDQLYSFVTERYDYRIDTSITPSYSLLCHGVGDSRAFATVYAAMCNRAGLECKVVSGTHEGNPWFWNMVQIDGVYYHVDLVSNSEFVCLLDVDMGGYVWDYSAYPACEAPVIQETEEQIQDSQDTYTEPTEVSQENGN